MDSTVGGLAMSLEFGWNVAALAILRRQARSVVRRRTDRSNTGSSGQTSGHPAISIASCQRYHELVDKRPGSELTVLERFEMERIEARLDAEAETPKPRLGIANGRGISYSRLKTCY